MTNIGSIVLSLPSSPDRRADMAISSQVQAISIANTLTRLILGPLADYVSPVHIGLLNGVRQYRRQPFVSRKIFLTGAALVSAAAHLSLGAFIRSQKGLLLLRSVALWYMCQSRHTDTAQASAQASHMEGRSLFCKGYASVFPFLN